MNKKTMDNFMERFGFVWGLCGLICLLFASQTFAAAGDFWIEPASTTVSSNGDFDLEVYVDTGEEKIGSYQVTITYDDTYLSIESVDDSGAVGGFNANTDNSGEIKVSAFEASGADGGTRVLLFTIHLKAANKSGTTTLSFTETILTDEQGNTIGTPNGTAATVTITLPQHSLTVTINGEGSVTSNPDGINCPTDCSEDYDEGTDITLIATPSAGYVFRGWSGACSGTGDCTVTMDSDTSVTATFIGPGTIGIQTKSISVIEANGQVQITLCRRDGTNGAVEVSYVTQDDSATAGVDYEATNGTITWADGEDGCKTFFVAILDNNTKDGQRSFLINLNVSGAEAAASQIRVTINDDDAEPAIVPTINEWGMIIFVSLTLGIGWFYLRKNRMVVK